jgi:hypothetical protein
MRWPDPLYPDTDTVQSGAAKTDVTVECHEGDGVAALATPTRPTCLATAMSLRPRCDVRINDLALNGYHQRLSLGDRQAEVLRPLRVLLEYRDLHGGAGGAVIGGDLKQDPDAHGAPPPMRIAESELSTTAGVES